jgi:hypothetical protein
MLAWVLGAMGANWRLALWELQHRKPQTEAELHKRSSATAGHDLRQRTTRAAASSSWVGL